MFDHEGILVTDVAVSNKRYSDEKALLGGD